jgi:hypothetical protein
LYAIYYSSNYHTSFHDITPGSGAGPGSDLATGIGSYQASDLAPALVADPNLSNAAFTGRTNLKGLRFLRRFRFARTVEGDRLANQRLEGGLVNFFCFVDVDRAACVSLETRVEETGRVL